MINKANSFSELKTLSLWNDLKRNREIIIVLNKYKLAVLQINTHVAKILLLVNVIQFLLIKVSQNLELNS